MPLTDSDITALMHWRHLLHQYPEISGEEVQTAEKVVAELSPLSASRIVTGLGGHGVAAVFDGAEPGPTVLFRCELDALPIQEKGEAPHASTCDGKAHLCGHDGHMAILAGLARCLSRQGVARGRVILLFQPAEETGAGAANVLADSRFGDLSPDFAFALHNLPGIPLGHVALKSGPICCASRGLKIDLSGTAAHASQPETGISPMQAISSLMPDLSALSKGTIEDGDFSLVTVTHVQMGKAAFGIAPGDATVFATLRSLTDDRMAQLSSAALDIATQTATRHGLTIAHEFRDVFHHCDNDVEATSILVAALDHLGMSHDNRGLPWRPSEDFGLFGRKAKSAMLFLGAGADQPPLHNPAYDFPDDLIPIGVRIFEQVAHDMLG